MLNISLPDTSNSIFSTAPLDLEDIKKYFVDKTINFQLDYSKSELHTEKFLIYVSNLGIPADLTLTKNLSFYQKFSLLEAIHEYFVSCFFTYFKFSSLIYCDET